MKKIRLIKHTAALALLLCSPFLKSAEAPDGIMDIAQALINLSEQAAPQANLMPAALTPSEEQGLKRKKKKATDIRPQELPGSPCNRCKTTFLNQHTSNVHKLKMEEAKAMNTLCAENDCCYAGETPHDAREHERSVHKNETIYRCSLCDKTFKARLLQMKTHFDKQHGGSGEIMLKCAGCLEWHPRREREIHVCAPTASALESEGPDHKRAAVQERLEFSEQTASQESPIPATLTSSEMHATPVPKQAPVHPEFQQKAIVTTLHLQPTAQPVAVAPKVSFVAATLILALKKPTTSQEIEAIPCTRCNKFYNPEGLIKHRSLMKKATKQNTLCPKNDCCHICKDSRDVDEHVRSSHNNEIIYRCSLCNKEIKSRSALHSHFTTHNNEGEIMLKCAGCETWHPHREREIHVCAPTASALESDGHTEKRARVDESAN